MDYFCAFCSEGGVARRRHSLAMTFGPGPQQDKLRAFKPARGMPRKPPAFTLLTPSVACH